MIVVSAFRVSAVQFVGVRHLRSLFGVESTGRKPCRARQKCRPAAQSPTRRSEEFEAWAPAVYGRHPLNVRVATRSATPMAIPLSRLPHTTVQCLTLSGETVTGFRRLCNRRSHGEERTIDVATGARREGAASAHRASRRQELELHRG